MKRLLFLCTGNYYRSRYAELLFNALASMVRLSWRADSRGLDLSAGKNNVGPLSSFVADRLSGRGFGLVAPPRMPVARFADWVHRVEYWHVHDADRVRPDEALSLIEREIERLLPRVKAQS